MSLTKLDVAKRYSKALYAVLEANDQVETGGADLDVIRAVLTDEPELTVALASTTLNHSQKETLLQPLLENVTTPAVQNLVKMLFDYGRISDLAAVIDAFKQLYNQKHGIVTATVTTAVPLSEEQHNQLAQTFAKKVNANQVELQDQINPEIIGGVILRSQDVIYDGSIKTKIDKMKRLLLQ
ncbi:ATP synthase F1 subunit delta [Fructilactobacillus cliffordii]|uniref:ATP synthase F1 subunit delta n=1 Tax=Fructilactobacillus cliffordii TaxID=2940299 RepID=UPI002093CFBC|nr:ATP synthase F1 subunit delta [Fructilactobacillus cliffordii]USS86844.1 ATP synthase F1 subunit delta [Fructilactobacillus cliffordii]